MQFLIAVVICFSVFRIGNYLGKRSKTCEIACILGVLLACAGTFLTALTNLVEMEPTDLDIILPVFKFFGVSFVVIGVSVVLILIVYARKCGLKEG